MKRGARLGMLLSSPVVVAAAAAAAGASPPPDVASPPRAMQDGAVAMAIPASSRLGGARPSTRPAVVGLSLPIQYSILMDRSLFARSGKAAPSRRGGPGPAASPESGLALRGLARDDTSFIAFIEDTASHRTLQLKSGDAVAAGRIRQISLDALAYESGGKLTQVRVGQNLLGVVLPPPVAPPATQPGSQPGGGPPPGALPPGAAMPPPGQAGGVEFQIGPNGRRIKAVGPQQSAAAPPQPQ